MAYDPKEYLQYLRETGQAEKAKQYERYLSETGQTASALPRIPSVRADASDTSGLRLPTEQEVSPTGYGGRVYAPSMARSYLSGWSGGTAPKVAGAIDAALDVLTKGADFKEAYTANTRAMQEAGDLYNARHPWADNLAKLAGGVSLVGGLSKGAQAARQLPRVGSKVAAGLEGATAAMTNPVSGGALVGGAAAWGTADPEMDAATMTKRVAIGAGVGAAGGKVLDKVVRAAINSPVGGELVSRAASVAARVAPKMGTELETLSRTTGKRGETVDFLADLIKNSGKTPDEIRTIVANRQGANLPEIIADITGGDVREVSRVIANSRGQRSTWEQALAERKGKDATQLTNEVLQEYGANTTGIERARDVYKLLENERRTEGGRLYAQAYDNGAAPILDDRLQALVQERPLMQKVMRRAEEMARNEGNPLPTIEVPPPKPGAAASIPDDKWVEMARAQGAMEVRPVLDVRGLDYVQRAIREGVREGFEGTPVSTQEAAAIRKGIDAVLDQVANDFPDLKAAREAYRIASRKIDAMDTGFDLYRYRENPGGGKKAAQFSVAELKNKLAQMSPDENGYFQVAAQDAARARTMNGTPSLLGQTRQLVGTPAQQEATSRAFGGNADALMADLERLREMGRTENKILSGSPTQGTAQFQEAYNPPSVGLIRDIFARGPRFVLADIANTAGRGVQRNLNQRALNDITTFLTAGARKNSSLSEALDQLIADLARRRAATAALSRGSQSTAAQAYYR